MVPQPSTLYSASWVPAVFSGTLDSHHVLKTKIKKPYLFYLKQHFVKTTLSAFNLTITAPVSVSNDPCISTQEINARILVPDFKCK